MIERRSRRKRALACTREQLVLFICASCVFIAFGIVNRPRASSALIVLFGFALGVVFHGCIRLVLALPALARRVDWESEPRLSSTPRYFAAGLLAAVLILPAASVAYLSAGEPSLLPFSGGLLLFPAGITAGRRFYLERDFARHFGAH